MNDWKSINWFRLLIVVGMSVLTSATLFYSDGELTKIEVFNAAVQCLIVGFSYLQCPEAVRHAALGLFGKGGKK